MTYSELNDVGKTGPLLCDLEETKRLLPISRTTLWELARDGKLEVVHIGRRRFFTYASIREFVSSLSATGSGDAL
jgi:hypothetical protein